MLHTDAVLDKAQQLKTDGRDFVLATVVRAESPTSAKPGAKALVTADGELIGWVGGGCAQPAVLDTAKKALRDGQARLIRVSPNKGGGVEEGIIDFGMTCHSGGTLDIFIDPVISQPALLIIGASPVAQSLSALARHAGFGVHAAFPGADAQLFPDALQVIDGLDLDQLRCGIPPFVVVATQGKRDEAGLEAALKLGASDIAFVASARKAGKLKQGLIERGQAAERVEAIKAPAGIEIGAVTPEEIAVSLLAGLIQARRRNPAVAPEPEAAATPSSCCGSETSADSKPEIEIPSVGGCCGGEAETTGVDPVCGMTVQIAGAEYVSRYAGQPFYFCCGGCQQRFDAEPQRYLGEQAAS
jgi:xanthine dehydrogenase accessory factor